MAFQPPATDRSLAHSRSDFRLDVIEICPSIPTDPVARIGSNTNPVDDVEEKEEVMDLRKLVEQEMVQLSTPWVANGSAVRAAIEAELMMAGLLPKLAAAHAGIVAVSAQGTDPEARALAAEASRLDAQHDDLVRTMDGALTILAKVSKNGDEHLRLRDLLFPEGLLHINKSHSAEAGHAAAITSALNPEVLARMKAIPIGDTTLFDLHARYRETAKQLGAVDEKRARLNRPSVTPAAQILAARREWIRWTKILMTMAENADVSPETDALLFGPLREAVQKSASRWRATIAPEPAPVPEPAPEPSKASSK
jgi:23S rRNA pseudoU1915 N3-methylase RlmH